MCFGQQRGVPKKRDTSCCDCACGGSNAGTYLWTGAGRQKLAVYGATVTRGMANTTATVGERGHNAVPTEGDYCRVRRGRGGSVLANVNRGPALTFSGPIPMVGGRQFAPPELGFFFLANTRDAQRKETGAAVTVPVAAVTPTPTRGLMLICRNELFTGEL